MLAGHNSERPAMLELDPDLRLIRADNPSPMTGRGTNSWLVGRAALCLIDPGPDDPRHLAAILQAIATTGGTLRAILVTHSHLDHSALAPRLSQATDAPVMAFGDSRAGRSSFMEALARDGIAAGGEGVDRTFAPDVTLEDGACVVLDDAQLRAIWTPGHFGNHICLRWRDAVFSGDHILGWSSSLVSPPDGDMGAYLRSLDRLDTEAARIFYPGHGDPVDNPSARIAELRAHRLSREALIRAAISEKSLSLQEIVAQVYTDTPPALHPAAARNVFAHLIDLHQRGRIAATPSLAASARFSLKKPG